MDGVRTVLQDDKTLWELLYAPFMLNIVTLAFKDRPPEYIRGTGTIEERREQIFDAYKDAMFDRPLRSTKWNQKYSRQQVEHWLSWLAKSMKGHSLSVFYLEHIQLDWLSLSQQKKLEIGYILLIGLLFGLATGLLGWLYYGLFVGLLNVLAFGPLGGLLGRLLEGVKQAEKLQFNPSNVVVFNGLLFVLIFWLVFGLSFWLASGLVSGLLFGLFPGLLFGLFFGLFFGLERKDLDIRRYPNEGIHRSAKNALLVGLLFGLGAGLLFGLTFGGSEYVRHYLLRIAFQRHNLAPLSYVDFLDYTADRIFLRKVGGGYVFIHRMILDYFASLEPDDPVDVYIPVPSQIKDYTPYILMR